MVLTNPRALETTLGFDRSETNNSVFSKNILKDYDKKVEKRLHLVIGHTQSS